MGAIEAGKGQERAKMMRKGATKMGPHQADSVLKVALNRKDPFVQKNDEI